MAARRRSVAPRKRNGKMRPHARLPRLPQGGGPGRDGHRGPPRRVPALPRRAALLLQLPRLRRDDEVRVPGAAGGAAQRQGAGERLRAVRVQEGGAGSEGGGSAGEGAVGAGRAVQEVSGQACRAERSAQINLGPWIRAALPMRGQLGCSWRRNSDGCAGPVPAGGGWSAIPKSRAKRGSTYQLEEP